MGGTSVAATGLRLPSQHGLQQLPPVVLNRFLFRAAFERHPEALLEQQPLDEPQKLVVGEQRPQQLPTSSKTYFLFIAESFSKLIAETPAELLARLLSPSFFSLEGSVRFHPSTHTRKSSNSSFLSTFRRCPAVEFAYKSWTLSFSIRTCSDRSFSYFFILPTYF